MPPLNHVFIDDKMKLSETAIQLQILSERASHIFDDILQLVTSLDERIESITRKTEKSEEVRNGFVSIQRERSSYLTSSSDRTNTQFLIPATRDERYPSKQSCKTLNQLELAQ